MDLMDYSLTRRSTQRNSHIENNKDETFSDCANQQQEQQDYPYYDKYHRGSLNILSQWKAVVKHFLFPGLGNVKIVLKLGLGIIMVLLLQSFISYGSQHGTSLTGNLPRAKNNVNIKPKAQSEVHLKRPKLKSVKVKHPPQYTFLTPPSITKDQHPPRRGKRKLNIAKSELEAQRHLKNSEIYRHNRHDPIEEDDCAVQYDWQRSFFPSCNKIHEVEMISLPLINAGYWRYVWKGSDFDGSNYVLKTIRYEHDYYSRNYERHRRDAVAMERLTSSPYVLDIYGFCGHSSVNTYGAGGDIKKVMFPPNNDKKTSLSKLERLKIASQVANGIADMHNFAKEGVSTISHADISLEQFILVDGVYKLNDFNRARFLNWNVRLDKPCGYFVSKNPSKFRSPEEYNYLEQNEKIDVYSMGNIFYVLLTNKMPFDKVKVAETKERVARGEKPFISEELKQSKDPSDIALLRAAQMCWKFNPKIRSSAREVAVFLAKAVESIVNSQ